jgi:cobalt-zinc-cadmium efflux system outer membrane protein
MFTLSFALLAAGCATASRQDAAPQLAARLGVPERTDAGTGTAIPPGVTLEDGLTQEEAVAVALWNNPDFRIQLTDLGFARADLLEAGLLRNPVLSILFPLGPKQLEATLRLPIEVLWERPRRVAAANVALSRVATGLEQFGLNLVADVKIAYVELALGRDRAALAEMAATQLEQIREITESRLRAGDISELEARSAAIDAARARQEAARARFDVQLRSHELRARLGLSLQPGDVTLGPAASTADACADRPGLVEELLKDALASRPDVRAAEIAVEAAGARLGWERARIIAVTAVLDANGAGKNGFEAGPGLDIGLPLFDRNQAGRARAAVELQRAGLAYVAARQRVATELTTARTQLEQARTTLGGWQASVVTPLEEQVRAAERAYAAGDTSYLFVLEMTRRLTDARVRIREVEADVARAIARMERAIGRTCDPKGLQIGD